jgi:hypothetical protein
VCNQYPPRDSGKTARQQGDKKHGEFEKRGANATHAVNVFPVTGGRRIAEKVGLVLLVGRRGTC